MAWELLPTNYTDAVWNGLKKYQEITNEDGTVSFQDVTTYTNRDNSFFGAKDANRMNEALNVIMSMVENGTDLYTAFQNYFTVQQTAFTAKADQTAEDFDAYIAALEKEGDETIIHGMNLLRLKVIRKILSPYYAYYCFKSDLFRSYEK